MLRVLTVATVIVFKTSTALAAMFCTAPNAPSFNDTKPRKPSVPYCINEYSHTSTCDEYTTSIFNSEVDQYNSNIQRYRSDADSYISELNSYLKKAKSYADCEADNL